MRGFIDTNIFVYATYPKFKEYPKAIGFLRECLQGKDSWHTSWSVVYEYLRVVTHPQLFLGETIALAKALDNVDKFCSAPNVEILQETEVHFLTLKKEGGPLHNIRGNLLHDLHMVILMKEHDVKKILTADTDFHRFSDIEVINPLK